MKWVCGFAVFHFGHPHLNSGTNSQALRAEYCIVNIAYNTAIYFDIWTEQMIKRYVRTNGWKVTTTGAWSLPPDYPFWATVCKTVRPMLSDSCPVCPVCPVLSVTFVHCGQTVGRIKMKLGMQVGLVPGHIVLGGTQLPLPKGAQSPQFSAHICCGQMAAWIKMSLGMEIGLGPGDFLLDWDPAPLPKRGRSPQIFGLCLLRPNGWMD